MKYKVLGTLSKIYRQKSYKLYEKQLKELDLMKNHRLIFQCKYWFIGIVKYNLKKFIVYHWYIQWLNV